MKISLLSVVVPVRDEADNVGPLIAEIRDALAERLPYEVFFVDDGSADATWKRLQEARAEILPSLCLIRHDRSCGQSAALRTGVEAARGDWVATLDGDGQNNPADLGSLLDVVEKAEDGSPLRLVASRRARRKDPWHRRMASRIANGVRSRILRDGVRDTGSGLKLIRRDAFLALPYFDHLHRYLPALVKRDGGGVEVVEVSHRPRRSGRSKYGILDRLAEGVVDLTAVWWLMRRRKLPRVVASELGERDSSR